MRTNQPSRKSKETGCQAGVTLIEMLVVMTIIALFAALVVPNMLKHGDQARIVKAHSDIQAFMTALNTYKLDTGLFPTTEQGLRALREKPTDVSQWAGPYIQQDVPKDPWNHDYVYHYPRGARSHRAGSHLLWRRRPTRRRGDQCRHRQLEEQLRRARH